MSGHRFAEQLFTEYQSLWYRIAYQYVHNAQDSQDIIQESYRKFLSIERDWDSLEDAKRYFSTILVHTSVDFYKLSKKRQENPLPSGESPAGNSAESTAWRRQCQKQEKEQEESILDSAIALIAQLPEEQKAAIVRLYLADQPRSLTELGRDLGVPISTLKSRALLGIEKVKKSLRKKGLL